MQRPWTLIVSAFDIRITTAAVTASRELGMSDEVLAPETWLAQPTHDAGGGGYYLLGSRLAAATHALPDPCVVVLAGARLRDEDLPRLAAPGVALLPIDKVAPAGLLNALMCADIGQGQAGHLVEAIESDPLLSRVPRTLWFAVLRAPQRMWTLDGLAAEVKFPKSRTKALVREAGFSDVRHFFTRVRANACRWMLCAGIDPPLARHHCGIIDRTTFERACGRADVNVPWRHVREGNPGT